MAIDKSLRRRFSKQERIALYLAADGKSELSGEPLGDAWHADHVVPWSKGGATNLANAQTLTAKENLMKGNMSHLMTWDDLRDWQRDFISCYRQHRAKDFLLAAIPGSGKTRASLYAIRDHVLDDSNGRLFVVVPSVQLQTDWQRQARKDFGIELLTRFTGHLSEDFRGAAITYQTVINSPLVFARLCAKYHTSVIFDEVHHSSEKKRWGKGIAAAFDGADRRLCLTGTPFRPDDERISFLATRPDPKNPGQLEYIVDFPYDYPAALRDKVVRYVAFNLHKGDVTVLKRGEIFKWHTNDDLDKDEEAQRLRSLICHETWVRGLLQQAHNKLLEVRQRCPQAGGLVLCIDTRHAEWVAQQLKSVTGEEPDIVVSDPEIGLSSIESYAKSSRKWIVSIKKVSEGIDIPRLMVLAFLTNTKTNLFFRQAIGRILRYQRTKTDREAYYFGPDVEPFRTYAAAIKEFQNQVTEEEEKERKPRDNETEDSDEWFETLASSDPELARLILTGEIYEGTRSQELIDIAREYGIEENVVAAIWARRTSSQGAVNNEGREETDGNEKTKLNLGKQCNKQAYRLSQLLDISPGEAHRLYGRKSHDEMSIRELTEKLQCLNKRIKEEIAKARK